MERGESEGEKDEKPTPPPFFIFFTWRVVRCLHASTVELYTQRAGRASKDAIRAEGAPPPGNAGKKERIKA